MRNIRISSPAAAKLAFSLVELSIVLVILGLLIGGVLSGQSLIRAAELRSVTSDGQRYLAAVYTFRDKYFAAPGDMATATTFWGKDGTYCAGDTGTVNATTGTCNGNGDGTTNATTGPSATAEIYQFWRQLALAGLIEGSYTGIAGPATDGLRGVNVPAAKPSGVGWNAQYSTAATVQATQYAVEMGNFMTVGAKTTGAYGAAYFKPEEAWSIDTKMDDGRPASGKVIAKFWNNLCSGPNSGAASQTNFDASYRLSDTTAQCAMHFIQLF